MADSLFSFLKLLLGSATRGYPWSASMQREALYHDRALRAASMERVDAARSALLIHSILDAAE